MITIEKERAVDCCGALLLCEGIFVGILKHTGMCGEIPETQSPDTGSKRKTVVSDRASDSVPSVRGIR